MWCMTEEGRCWLAALRGLAQGLTYPDPDWTGMLVDGRWLAAMTEVLEPLRLAPDGLSQAIEELPAQPAAALEALQVEYTYLFINAVPHVPAPPYASAYAGDGLLMGEPAEAAVRAYRMAGLELAEDYHNLPDHLAAELEFLGWLGEEGASALVGGDDERARELVNLLRRFLLEQVRPWVPEFRQRVEEAARMTLYPQLARLAEGVLAFASTPAPC